MADPSRSERVLAALVERFPHPSDDNGQLRLVDAWTDGPDTVCVVYEGWWQSRPIGLRREVEPHLPLWQVVVNILDGELGEPPGLMVEGVQPDERGIVWWHGDLPEWREYR